MATSRSVVKPLGMLTGCLVLLCGSLHHAQAQEPAPTSSSAAAPAVQQSPTNLVLKRTVEDFDVPAANRNQLKMEPPTPGEIDHLPSYTRERLQVQWRNLDPIDLYVVTPVGVKNPPVILYLYSADTASKQAFINDGWCQRVTSGGFAAVGFVPALTEDRFFGEMRPMKEWFLSELQEALGSTTHDVQLILDYLEERKDIDASHAGILGIGSGATVAILAAAADPRIKALDLINPWGDWPDWLAGTPFLQPVERKDYLTPEFLAKVAPLDPVKWLPKLTSQSVRLQVVEDSFGGRDPLKTAMRKLERVAPDSVEIVHYDNEQHIKESIYRTGGSFQWVKDQLRPAPPLSSSVSSEPVAAVPAKQ